MNKVLIITVLALMIGFASATTQGFGEVASLNACHCLVFNSTNSINSWTLVSTYNRSLEFTITLPQISNVIVKTTVTNGIIQADSRYTIGVNVISHSNVNTSGYLIAYVSSINSSNTTGASIKIGTEKLMKISANTSIIKNDTANVPIHNDYWDYGSTLSTNAPTSGNITIEGNVADSHPTTGVNYVFLIAGITLMLSIIIILIYYNFKQKR